jgi:RNA polymerase sigma-70 factor (ECF subfamily)
MSDSEDRSLVARCLQGDRAAFERLVDRYQRVMFNVALRMVNNRDDAMDVTQTAFIKAYEKLDSYNPEYRFFSWLYRILVNESLNLLGRRKPQEEVDTRLPSRDKTPDLAYGEDQVRERLQAAIESLPADYQRVLVLRHYGDLSYKDMSEILDLPEKTVKSRLFTARRMLRDVLLKRGVVGA